MKKFIAILALLFITASCVEATVISFGAGTIVATRNKSLSDTKDDVIIAAKIDKEFLVNGLKTPRNSVEVMVSEGRVLITGEIRDLQKGKKAVEIIWKIKGVKELIDEVEIKKEDLRIADFGGVISDTYLTSKIKTKLFFNRKVSLADYKISSFNHSVYLLGIAKDRAEIDEVLRVISKTSGIKKVVNHVILANDSRRNG
ncbi:MAG TPA: BON domain-containing protein [Rickettsiales bacterium]|nr:BON domain-containing protein [Rickettsiales bacterium]